MNHSINPVLRFNWQHISRCAFTTFIVNCFHVYHVKWETRKSVAVKWKSLSWFCYLYVGLLTNIFHCRLLSHISMPCHIRCMLLFIHNFGMEWFHISPDMFFNVFSSSDVSLQLNNISVSMSFRMEDKLLVKVLIMFSRIFPFGR